MSPKEEGLSEILSMSPSRLNSNPALLFPIGGSTATATATPTFIVLSLTALGIGMKLWWVMFPDQLINCHWAFLTSLAFTSIQDSMRARDSSKAVSCK